jgi:hypothetical protein
MFKITLKVLLSVFVFTVFLEGASSRYLYDSYYIHKKNTKKKIIKKRKKVKKRVIKKRIKKKKIRKKRIKKKSTSSTLPKLSKRKYHLFFGKAGLYYSGIEIGQTKLSRDVTLNSKDTGQTLYKSGTGDELGPADGSTYTFNQSTSYSRVTLDIGFQEARSGNFYQLSWYSNDYVQDLLFTFGFSYKKFGYRYIYGVIPFLKVDLGFGHTGTTNGMPTNYTYGVGVGVTKNIKRFHLKGGFAYQKRNWAYIDKDVGTEKWEDSETTLYVGAAYLF